MLSEYQQSLVLSFNGDATTVNISRHGLRYNVSIDADMPCVISTGLSAEGAIYVAYAVCLFFYQSFKRFLDVCYD